MAIPAGMYFVRVAVPGYGPKIVTSFMSDLGPLSSSNQQGPYTDLRSNTCFFSGNGAPSGTTLLPGNYDAGIPGSGYLAWSDFYVDNSNPSTPNLYVCTQSGSSAGSQWQKISGGTSANWNYRGLYVGGTAYSIFDVVQFGAGTASGMYLSTINNNGNLPDIGPGWIQVSSSAGAWI